MNMFDEEDPNISAVFSQIVQFARSDEFIGPALDVLLDAEKLLVFKGKDYSSLFPVEWGAAVEAAHLSNQHPDFIFSTLLAVKMARAMNVSSKTKLNYESLFDTYKDMLNYLVLWLAYKRSEYEIHTDSSD